MFFEVPVYSRSSNRCMVAMTSAILPYSRSCWCYLEAACVCTQSPVGWLLTRHLHPRQWSFLKPEWLTQLQSDGEDVSQGCCVPLGQGDNVFSPPLPLYHGHSSSKSLGLPALPLAVTGQKSSCQTKVTQGAGSRGDSSASPIIFLD